ncbi:hypothetical protein LDY98_19910, partial [Pseudomonas aeruginosa]|nr:hypothetical protein [Pseudomonas aeruginosa]
EGVGATAAALVDLSTVAGNKISNPPWVKFQSAGWVNFPSAPTVLHFQRPVACFNWLAAACQLREPGGCSGLLGEASGVEPLSASYR